ncbi:hypothetical protein KR067_010246, partial [Drosophila pandora]
MLSTRKEVDEQVHKLLGKMPPGKERDFKGLAVARLYNRINEYPKAIEYLNSYLRAKDEAVAHKLIAHCYKNLKTPDLQKALQHYQRCIQLSPRQPDVIKEACQLLLDEKGLFNAERAKYWLDLAAGEDLSENELVFALKMRVEHRESNGKMGATIEDDNNLELLMHKELQARPHDVNVRIRLLRSYVEKKNLDQAFNYAYKVELEEATGCTSQSSQWYEVIWMLLAKMELAKDVKKNVRFWYLALHCLDRLMQLSLETGNCLADSSSQLFRLDQYLYKFNNVLDRSGDPSQRELQQTCVDHYAGQLLLHAVALIFKRELLGNKNKWMVTLRGVLPILFLGYQLRPPKEEGHENLWVKHCDADQKNLLRTWRQQGSFRCAQLGRTLWGCLEPETQKENHNPQQPSYSGLFANTEDLFSCLRQQCNDKNWRRQLYQQLFTHAEHKLKEQSSHLVRHPRLQSPVAEWPDLAEIEGYELEALNLPPHSLNMHVYLALGSDANNLGDAQRVVFYEGFPRDVKQNLSYCGYESICQLDVDVYLYATVIQTQRRLQIHRETYESSNLGNRSAGARPLMMPYSNIVAQLAAPEQSHWWDLVLRLHRNQLSTEGNRAEQRAQLQLGLEAVRGVNGPKADAIIVFRLGKILQSRADRSALETRIETLYRHGFTMMRRQQQQQLDPFTRVFKYGSPGSTFAWQELQTLAEHAVSYFSGKMFKAGQYEQFVDEVRGLNLPMASYLQAEAYRQLEDSGKTPRVSRARYSERRRECLQQTNELLRNDVQHPLSSVIQRELRRCQQNRSFQAGGDDSFGTPELHNNSSTYEDAEDDFYSGAANRSRRQLNSTTTPATPQQVVLTTAPPSQEMEQTVKQISKSLCLLKDDVSVGLEGMMQEIKNLNERFNGLEDLLKKLKIGARETPTRDVDPAAALGLDDLFIIEDALAEQQQQQQTAAHQVVQPAYGGPAPGYYNGMPNTPSAQERFLQGAYASPIYNQNQMYNFYAAQAQAQAQYMRTPPAPVAGIPPTNMFGPRNQNFGLPSMFPPPPGGQGAPYIDPLANFSQPPPSLLPPAPQPAPGPVPVPTPVPLNLGEPKGAAGGGFFNTSSPAFAQQTKPLATPSVSAPAPAAPAALASLPAVATAPPVSAAPQAAPVTAPPIFNRALNNQPVEKEPPANVVITSSDPLPKPTVTSVQPPLSVTIPAQHIKPSLVQASAEPPQVQLPAATGPFNFSFGTSATDSPFSFKSQVAQAAAEKQKEKELEEADQNKSAASDANKSGAADNSLAEDYDPRPDFQPIIPLPDEVEVKTGEEDEQVKFSHRAKLFRHVDKEWKERGTGLIKILHNSSTGLSRVLMRREQTHKICANHTITGDMTIAYSSQDKGNKTLMWAANDFADEQLTLEKFLVRFKTPETAEEFRVAFTKVAEQSAKSKPVEKPKETSVAPAAASASSSVIFNQPKSFVTSTPASNLFNKPQDQAKPKQSEPNSAPEVAKSLFGGLSSLSKAPPTSTPSTTAAPSPFANFSFSGTTSGLGTGGSPFGNLSFGSVSAVGTTGNSTLFTTALVKDNTLQQQPQPQQQQLNKSSASDAEDEYVPTAQFVPVIQLPELVEVVTGEENEEVLFEHRAKLLRFDKEANEWKERGLGNMKVLRDRSDPHQVRLLMRREQVHKLCCNQRLLPDTKFSFALNLKAAVTWAGQDYSEAELTTELMCVRFKTPELCQQFLDAIKEAQDGMRSAKKEEPAKKSEPEKPVKGFGDAFKPKTGSWSCDSCYTSNDKDQTKCVACQEPKDKTAQPSGGMEQSGALNLSTSTTGQFSFGFAPNGGKASSGGFTFGSSTVSTASPSVAAPKTGSGGLTFGSSTASAASPSVTTPKSTGTLGFGDAFKPKAGSWSCSSCYLSNSAEASKCSACETPKDGSEPKKETLGSGIRLPATTTFSFGFSPQPASKDQSSAPEQTPKPASGLLGSATFNFTPSASAPAAPAGPSQVVAPAASIGSTNFNFSMPKPAQLQPKSPTAAVGNEGEDNEYHEEEENNAYFAPVIPLPDKVDVKTGEEDEEVLYSHRAKLYRLWENSEWKERGLGDVKILRHKETKKLRVVMRREQVFKICLNHVLNEFTPTYKMKDERSWMFAAHDFSEGESVLDRFTLRFKNAEIAQEFYAAITNAVAGPDGAQVVTEAAAQKECSGCRGCDSDTFLFPKAVGGLENISAEEDASATLPMYQPALKLPPPGFVANTTSPLFKASSLGTPNPAPFTGFGNLSVSEENKPPSSTFLFGNLNLSGLGKPASATPPFGVKPSSFGSGPQGNVLGSIFGGGTSDSQSSTSDSTKSIFGGVQEKSDLSKSIFGGVPQKSEDSKSIFGNLDQPNSSVDSIPSIFGGLQQKLEGSKSTFGAGGASSVGGSGGFLFGPSGKAPGSIFEQKTNLFSNFAKPTDGEKLSEGEKSNESKEQKDNDKEPEKTPAFAFGGGDMKDKKTPGFADLAAKTGSTFADLAAKSGGTFADLAAKSGTTFADISAKNPGTEAVGFKKAAGGGFYNLTHQNAFKNFQSPHNESGKDAGDGDEDGDATNDDNYDPHYDPIVELPDEIVVTTGEENETKLFGERAKLFRYDSETKQWKERGSGEIKVLEHTELKKFRLLMRQEQIHKLVLNMRISYDMRLDYMNEQKKSFLWAGYNYAVDAEGKMSTEGVCERLAVRFQKLEVADEFLAKVNSCIQRAKIL